MIEAEEMLFDSLIYRYPLIAHRSYLSLKFASTLVFLLTDSVRASLVWDEACGRTALLLYALRFCRYEETVLVAQQSICTNRYWSRYTVITEQHSCRCVSSYTHALVEDTIAHQRRIIHL